MRRCLPGTKVMLHTHLAENDEDIAYSLSQFGCRPGQYAGRPGLDRRRCVGYAHCVKLDSSEIELFCPVHDGCFPLSMFEL